LNTWTTQSFFNWGFHCIVCIFHCNVHTNSTTSNACKVSQRRAHSTSVSSIGECNVLNLLTVEKTWNRAWNAIASNIDNVWSCTWYVLIGNWYHTLYNLQWSMADWKNKSLQQWLGHVIFYDAVDVIGDAGRLFNLGCKVDGWNRLVLELSFHRLSGRQIETVILLKSHAYKL